jgi:tetratricopeptide (TPR) repeat protein
VDKSYTLTYKADVQAKVDPVAAVKIYEQALDLWPDNPQALFGLGDCKEAITGDPKAAIPYYRKGLFDGTTSEFDASSYYSDQLLLTASLLFERGGEHAVAVKIYNRAAASVNRDLERKAYGWKLYSAKGEIPIPYEPTRLPILTDKSTSLDLACYAHVGLGIDSTKHGLQIDRSEFETAMAIENTPVAKFYLDKNKKEHPNLYTDTKPVQQSKQR